MDDFLPAEPDHCLKACMPLKEKREEMLIICVLFLKTNEIFSG